MLYESQNNKLNMIIGNADSFYKIYHKMYGKLNTLIFIVKGYES